MAFCALKNRASAYLIFQGGSNLSYPKWFTDYILENSYIDEDRRWRWVESSPYINSKNQVWNEDVLTEGFDVFLRNHHGKVRRTDIEVLDEMYNIIADGTVAYWKDCIEYTIFKKGESMIQPNWFEDFYVVTLKPMVNSGYITECAVLIKYNESFDPIYQIVDLDLFKEYYFYMGNGIDWGAF